jgi:hypothetical protein
VHVCSIVASGVYGVEVKIGIEQICAVCIYPCPNMLAVVCCDILKVRAEPSMVVQL